MENQSTTMECHPPRTPLRDWPKAILIMAAAVLMFGCLIFVGLLMVSELVTHYQTTQQAKFILLAAGCTVGAALLVIFIRWEQDRWYWVLENDRLIGGKRKDKVFPFSFIKTIVPGLPDKTNSLVAANKFVNPELWAGLMTERKIAILLKFYDRSFMPFHVHRCANGTPLMTELVTRLADRIDHDYQYTPQEIKALQLADWNKVVKERIWRS